MVRVLFVNAVDPVSEVENRYRPLWPAYLAAAAEKRLGERTVEFRFATGRADGEIESYDPHIVAISAVTQNFNRAVEYTRVAKTAGKEVILGGIHVTAIPEGLPDSATVGCIGEGEDTFIDLLQCYHQTGGLAASALKRIAGVVYRDSGKLERTPPRPLCNPLDLLPHPKRDVIGYQRHDYVFSSRGCPYRCHFCASSRFWEKVRFNSAGYVMEELRELAAHGVKMISFYDDLFIADKRRLQDLVAMIKAEGLDCQVRFTCSCRANLVTPQVVELLKAMNTVSVGMGLESGCQRTLDYLKGGVTVEQNERAVNLLKNAGIQANASFVIGSPDETRNEILETYDFIRKSRLDFFDTYVLTPLPGTPLWDEARAAGQVSDSMDWDLLNINFESCPGQTVIISRQLTRQSMLRLYRQFRRLRFWRILKALPRSAWLRDLPQVVGGLWRQWIGSMLAVVRSDRVAGGQSGSVD